MHLASFPRRFVWLPGRRALACLIVLAGGIAAVAAEDPPPAAQEGAAPAFQPGELSIGDPIPLPFGDRTAAPGAPAADPSTPAARPADDPRAAAPAQATVPGSGWLGLAVGESNVPGRWRVEEVVAGGPAARAGIAAGDELRAINGVTLAGAAEVSQALTSIAAGQDVRVAVARNDRVSDVVLRAEARPAARTDGPGRGATQPPAGIPDRPSAFAASAPTAAAPPEPLPMPRRAEQPEAGGPAWQGSSGQDVAADRSRFAPLPSSAAAGVQSAAGPRPAVAATPLPQAPTGGGGPATGRTALGVRSVPVDPATQAMFRLAAPAGAHVISVVQDLPAARAGLPPGSVIVAFDERPVRSPEELTEIVASGPLDKPVTVQYVLPGGEAKRAAVTLQALDPPLVRALGGSPTTAAPPTLRPAPLPRRTERLAADDGDIRAEILTLRGRLERLERLLDSRQGDPR